MQGAKARPGVLGAVAILRVMSLREGMERTNVEPLRAS